MLDYVGKYMQDSMGNMLPMTQDIVAPYVGHDGTRIWVQSPTGDSSDSLLFTHYVGVSMIETINNIYKGKMVRVHRVAQYDRHVDMWGYFNTLHLA